MPVWRLAVSSFPFLCCRTPVWSLCQSGGWQLWSCLFLCCRTLGWSLCQSGGWQLWSCLFLRCRTLGWSLCQSGGWQLCHACFCAVVIGPGSQVRFTLYALIKFLLVLNRRHKHNPLNPVMFTTFALNSEVLVLNPRPYTSHTNPSTLSCSHPMPCHALNCRLLNL